MAKTLTIIGCGPGAPEWVTPAAQAAAREAELLLGSETLLALIPIGPGRREIVSASSQKVIAAIAVASERRIAILVTGDPGVSSLATPLLRHFGPACCRVIPGISSVQLAFARIGEAWDHARIISAHGQCPNETPERLVETSHLALLAGGEAGREWLEAAVRTLAPTHTLWACEELGWPKERVSEVTPETIDLKNRASRTILLAVKRR